MNQTAVVKFRQVKHITVIYISIICASVPHLLAKDINGKKLISCPPGGKLFSKLLLQHNASHDLF